MHTKTFNCLDKNNSNCNTFLGKAVGSPTVQKHANNAKHKMEDVYELHYL